MYDNMYLYNIYAYYFLQTLLILLIRIQMSITENKFRYTM